MHRNFNEYPAIAYHGSVNPRVDNYYKLIVSYQFSVVRILDERDKVKKLSDIYIGLFALEK